MAEYVSEDAKSPFSPVDASFSGVKWTPDKRVIADLMARDGSSKVRVTFEGVVVWRMLDGLGIANEDGWENRGVTATSLIYMVKGAHFWSMHHSDLGNFPDANHYRIMTPEAAVDVIATVRPRTRTVQIASSNA